MLTAIPPADSPKIVTRRESLSCRCLSETERSVELVPGWRVQRLFCPIERFAQSRDTQNMKWRSRVAITRSVQSGSKHGRLSTATVQLHLLSRIRPCGGCDA